MKKNIIDETSAKVQKMLENREAEITRLEVAEKAARIRKSTAIDAKRAAVEAGDDAAYSAARRELQEAQDIIDLNTERIALLKNKPLASKADAAKMSDDILDEIIKSQDALAKKIVEVIEGLVPEASELKSKINNGNQLLMSIRSDILKEKGEPAIYNVWDGAWHLIEKFINDPKYVEFSGIRGDGFYAHREL